MMQKSKSNSGGSLNRTKGSITPTQPSTIPEESRIRLTKQLTQLRDDCKLDKIVFPSTLSKFERSFIHNLADELGLSHKSSGKDEKRFITVSKIVETNLEKDQEDSSKVPTFSLSPMAMGILQNTISQFPLKLHSTSDPQVTQSKPMTGRYSFLKNQRDVDQFDSILRTSHSLSQLKRNSHPNYQNLLKMRSELPAFQYQDEICQLLRNHNVILISGETGCGKSTQIPQFILDDPQFGPEARILVTQPRRLSAMTLAERVAYERGESLGPTEKGEQNPSMGSSNNNNNNKPSSLDSPVGYQVRLDGVHHAHTQLLFLTPGLLLRKLQSEPNLLPYTHIILDEVHERDRFTDFLLIILKEFIQQQEREFQEGKREREGGDDVVGSDDYDGSLSQCAFRRKHPLKLILMSASLQTQRLSTYFDQIPHIHMRGRVHPVQSLFLEDVLRVTKYNEKLAKVNQKHSPSLQRSYSDPISIASLTSSSSSTDSSSPTFSSYSQALESYTKLHTRVTCPLCGREGLMGGEELALHLFSCDPLSTPSSSSSSTSTSSSKYQQQQQQQRNTHSKKPSLTPSLSPSPSLLSSTSSNNLGSSLFGSAENSLKKLNEFCQIQMTIPTSSPSPSPLNEFLDSSSSSEEIDTIHQENVDDNHHDEDDEDEDDDGFSPSVSRSASIFRSIPLIRSHSDPISSSYTLSTSSTPNSTTTSSSSSSEDQSIQFYHRHWDDSQIDYDLIVELISYIYQSEFWEAMKKMTLLSSPSTSSISNSNSQDMKTKSYSKKQQQSQQSEQDRLYQQSGGGGSILIFLPGWEEIQQLTTLLSSPMIKAKLNQSYYSPSSSSPSSHSSHSTFRSQENFTYNILQLHSSIPKKEQDLVFSSINHQLRERKIILSTNIAETSLTINDVLVVINTGKVKEKFYDPYIKLSYLKSNWSSQSSALQRQGRAGRVQPGVCFHLFSRQRFDSFPLFGESELLKMPLEEVVLQAKLLGLCPGKEKKNNPSHHSTLTSSSRSRSTSQSKQQSYRNRNRLNLSVSQFLSLALDPPHPLSISNAVELLKDLHALDPVTESLTPLGTRLAELPLDPRIGKFLLIGSLFGIESQSLMMAAVISYKEPFLMAGGGNLNGGRGGGGGGGNGDLNPRERLDRIKQNYLRIESTSSSSSSSSSGSSSRWFYPCDLLASMRALTEFIKIYDSEKSSTNSRHGYNNNNNNNNNNQNNNKISSYSSSSSSSLSSVSPHVSHSYRLVRYCEDHMLSYPTLLFLSELVSQMKWTLRDLEENQQRKDEIIMLRWTQQEEKLLKNSASSLPLTLSSSSSSSTSQKQTKQQQQQQNKHQNQILNSSSSSSIGGWGYFGEGKNGSSFRERHILDRSSFHAGDLRLILSLVGMALYPDTAHRMSGSKLFTTRGGKFETTTTTTSPTSPSSSISKKQTATPNHNKNNKEEEEEEDQEERENESLLLDLGLTLNGRKKVKIHPSSVNCKVHDPLFSKPLPLLHPSSPPIVQFLSYQSLVTLEKGDDFIGGASLQMLGTAPLSSFAFLLTAGRITPLSTLQRQKKELIAKQTMKKQQQLQLQQQTQQQQLLLLNQKKKEDLNENKEKMKKKKKKSIKKKSIQKDEAISISIISHDDEKNTQFSLIPPPPSPPSDSTPPSPSSPSSPPFPLTPLLSRGSSRGLTVAAMLLNKGKSPSFPSPSTPPTAEPHSTTPPTTTPLTLDTTTTDFPSSSSSSTSSSTSSPSLTQPSFPSPPSSPPSPSSVPFFTSTHSSSSQLSSPRPNSQATSSLLSLLRIQPSTTTTTTTPISSSSSITSETEEPKGEKEEEEEEKVEEEESDEGSDDDEDNADEDDENQDEIEEEDDDDEDLSFDWEAMERDIREEGMTGGGGGRGGTGSLVRVVVDGRLVLRIPSSHLLLILKCRSLLNQALTMMTAPSSLLRKMTKTNNVNHQSSLFPSSSSSSFHSSPISASNPLIEEEKIKRGIEGLIEALIIETSLSLNLSSLPLPSSSSSSSSFHSSISPHTTTTSKTSTTTHNATTTNNTNTTTTTTTTTSSSSKSMKPNSKYAPYYPSTPPTPPLLSVPLSLHHPTSLSRSTSQSSDSSFYSSSSPYSSPSPSPSSSNSSTTFTIQLPTPSPSSSSSSSSSSSPLSAHAPSFVPPRFSPSNTPPSTPLTPSTPSINSFPPPTPSTPPSPHLHFNSNRNHKSNQRNNNNTRINNSSSFPSSPTPTVQVYNYHPTPTPSSLLRS